jgi:hypothetical protein
MMASVVVVAVNFAYLRSYGVSPTLVGTCLPVLILQAGLIGALCGQNLSRLFWRGFVAFGSLALLGWFGVGYVLVYIEDGPYAHALDECYGRVMDAVLRQFPLSGYDHLMPYETSHLALGEVLLTIPQLLVSLLGGVLAVKVFKPPGTSSQRTHPNQP